MKKKYLDLFNIHVCLSKILILPIMIYSNYSFGSLTISPNDAHPNTAENDRFANYNKAYLIDENGSFVCSISANQNPSLFHSIPLQYQKNTFEPISNSFSLDELPPCQNYEIEKAQYLVENSNFVGEQTAALPLLAAPLVVPGVSKAAAFVTVALCGLAVFDGLYIADQAINPPEQLFELKSFAMTTHSKIEESGHSEAEKIKHISFGTALNVTSIAQPTFYYNFIGALKDKFGRKLTGDILLRSVGLRAIRTTSYFSISTLVCTGVGATAYSILFAK